jgi:hypothetical protein
VPLRLPRLAEVFQRPQGPQRAVEKRQQIRDQNVVEMQPPIAVRLLVAQRTGEPFEHPHVLATDDLLRPIRQGRGLGDRRSTTRARAHARSLRNLGRGRKSNF